MHESLVNYIRSHSTTPLSNSDLELIKQVFVPKKLRKHQHFLQEGEVCKYSAFVVKGAMRQFTIDERGIEHVVRLSIENWWVVDRESYSMLTPSTCNIDACEDCELLLITKADYLGRLSTIPAVNEMTLKMYENFTIATQKRLSSIGLPAEERYIDLVKNYPEFLQRFPLHTIASYLGITKETLSRIRSHSLKK